MTLTHGAVSTEFPSASASSTTLATSSSWILYCSVLLSAWDDAMTNFLVNFFLKRESRTFFLYVREKNVHVPSLLPH